MKTSTYPTKVICAVVVITLLINLATVVEGGKITEKTKKYSNKERETGCVEGKEGATCTKSVRNGIEKPNPNDVAIPNRRPSLAKRFERAMNFAERMIVEFTREILGFYGMERSGWEMGVIELIVRTVAKDMLFIMQAMQF